MLLKLANIQALAIVTYENLWITFFLVLINTRLEMYPVPWQTLKRVVVKNIYNSNEQCHSSSSSSVSYNFPKWIIPHQKQFTKCKQICSNISTMYNWIHGLLQKYYVKQMILGDFQSSSHFRSMNFSKEKQFKCAWFQHNSCQQSHSEFI